MANKSKSYFVAASLCDLLQYMYESGSVNAKQLFFSFYSLQRNWEAVCSTRVACYHLHHISPKFIHIYIYLLLRVSVYSQKQELDVLR